jgi:hypothetical protein
MRSFLFFSVLFLLAGKGAAQESIPEMSDRATETFNPADAFRKATSHASAYQKITFTKEQSIYADRSTALLRSQLLTSRNREIMKYVDKAGKNRKTEFIAFAAVPLGILAAACIRQNPLGNNWMKPAGITCLAASLSCIIISPVAHYRKEVNYKKAIQLYNARF